MTVLGEFRVIGLGGEEIEERRFCPKMGGSTLAIGLIERPVDVGCRGKGSESLWVIGLVDSVPFEEPMHRTPNLRPNCLECF